MRFLSKIQVTKKPLVRVSMSVGRTVQRQIGTFAPILDQHKLEL